MNVHCSGKSIYDKAALVPKDSHNLTVILEQSWADIEP